MGPLSRFIALPASDRGLVVAAAGLLAAVRVGLWLLPLRWVQGIIRALETSPRPADGGTPALARIGWAIAAAGQRVPRSTCLVRALAAQGLYARHGYATQLRLGVARGPDRAFEAHAWLERDGQVLVGGPVEPRYVPLPALDIHGPPPSEGHPIDARGATGAE